MTLLERIESAMRDGMRARDEPRVATLRLVMAAAQNRRIELGRALTDDDLIDVLARQAKQRRESIEQFRAGGREELAEREEVELAIIGEYLPSQLDAAEVERTVAETIAATGATSPGDMGPVMGALMPRLKGRVTGSALSDEVRRQLAGASTAADRAAREA